MGYYIDVVDADFVIPAAVLDLAYVAACDLNNDPDVKSGGSSSGARWFSWVSENYPETCKDIFEVMQEWRYECEQNDDGDLVFREFTGEKIGDEEQLFAALGPYAKENSFLEFKGEDDARWRFTFDGTKMVPQNGVVHVTWVDA